MTTERMIEYAAEHGWLDRLSREERIDCAVRLGYYRRFGSSATHEMRRSLALMDLGVWGYSMEAPPHWFQKEARAVRQAWRDIYGV